MKPIWYFVGLLLAILGSIIMLNGFYLLLSPAEQKTVLYNLHPNIWWGGLITIVGILFVILNMKKRIA